MPGRYASQPGRGGRTGGHIPAGLNGLFADTLTQLGVGVVEILEKVGEEGVPVRSDSFLDSLEHTTVHTFLVVWRFEEKGRDRGDNDGMAHVFRSVLADVTGLFAAVLRNSHQGIDSYFVLSHLFV